ncbi:hypothetical protein HETIRDRAFT_449836 [Heterobasidion irregulare TC 32-1]|uniref:Rdx family-domain-containing protein n=1 Tax=Heterobasidion irregulare (strain TC 32-1) TaxID=747525 RepID=W4KH21_HETIT|nr:uncharacterized protein HETIRDRAFT_449836 [Heterobasidion irregulare TC 32-1]ETW84331.1 hypothetical protein HETIRDRAFT_449836 [Heterobasidion irregulare TC 32-1]
MADSNDQACVDCAPSRDLFSQIQDNTATKIYDPIDPTTFVPPTPGSPPSVAIEYCDRCRWLHRATWVSTELFLTFPAPALKGVTIIPLNSEETSGRFRVWLTLDQEPTPILVWDRKVEGKFPELKELKQRIRDHIQPGKSLGHSDKK